MTHITDEAVNAAYNCGKALHMTGSAGDFRAVLAAALPFLAAQWAVSNTKIEVALQPLDDIYVRDGFCDWADVANARDEIRRRLSALGPSAALETDWQAVIDRPIVGIEHRTPQEVHDILRDRIKHAALSSPDHADAGKVEGDGWEMTPPKFHRYPYFVENISGKWCLCKHHGNGAWHTVSAHETAREARDAAPASEGAE